MVVTIDNLPTEILCIIFKDLCLYDISNCSQTCLRWNYCIEVLFKDKGRIAVIAGENRGWAQHTEVIDLTNSYLKYENLPEVSERFGSVGGSLSGQPLICGGYNVHEDEYFRDCLNLGNPKNKMDLLQKRANAASVVLDHDTLWVVGGESGFDDLKSTEFISLHQSPIEGPILPFTIERHSMVLYNDLSMIYIIGGYQDRKLSNRTWIVDLSNGFTIKEGPSMNFARSCHATGKIKVNGKTLLVVAGGEFKPGHISDSVEILDPLSGNGWIQGPNLPFKLSGAAIVTLPKISRLVLIGGYSGTDDEYCDKIMELTNLNQNNHNLMEWIVLEQELESARYGHVAYVIPDQLTSCKLMEEEQIVHNPSYFYFNAKKRARVFRDPYSSPMATHKECSLCPHTSLFDKNGFAKFLANWKMDKVDNKQELLMQFLKKKRQLQETQKTCPVAIAVFDEKNQLITVEFDSGNIS